MEIIHFATSTLPLHILVTSLTRASSPIEVKLLGSKWVLYINGSSLINDEPATLNKNWNDARHFCISLGGDLASVTEKEYVTLSSYINQLFKDQVGGNYLTLDRQAWLGARRKTGSTQFEYTDGTGVINYMPWGSGYPSHNDDMSQDYCSRFQIDKDFFKDVEMHAQDVDCTAKGGYRCLAPTTTVAPETTVGTSETQGGNQTVTEVSATSETNVSGLLLYIWGIVAGMAIIVILLQLLALSRRARGQPGQPRETQSSSDPSQHANSTDPSQHANSTDSIATDD